MSYCASRYQTVRRRTLEVKVGAVGIGGDNPVRIQSMTTSDTQDIAATVLFLCRREAHNLTGAAVPVDGGFLAA